MSEEGQTTEVKPKAKRVRKCKDIIAVTKEETADGVAILRALPGWSRDITRMEKAVRIAKKIQTDAAKAQQPVPEITFIRRLGMLKGKSQIVMAFTVE